MNKKYRSILLLNIVMALSLLIIVCFLHNILRLPWMHVYWGLEDGGIGGVGSANFLAICEWMWIYFPLWIVPGYYIEYELNHMAVTLYRYGTFKRWGRSLITVILLFDGTFIAILGCMYMITMPGMPLWPVFCIGFHGFFMLSVYSMLRNVTGRASLAILGMLLLEFFMLVIGDELQFDMKIIPAFWGMYRRSEDMLLDGFNTIYAIITQSFSGMFLLGGSIYIAGKNFKRGFCNGTLYKSGERM